MSRHQEAFCGAGIQAKYGNFNGAVGARPFGLEQFESLWADYTAISGEIPASFAEELIALYPEAKIILMVRDDEEAWVRSLTNTIWYASVTPLAVALSYVSPKHRDLKRIFDPFWRYLFFNDLPRHGMRVYREHNAMVKRLVAPERLLVFDAKHGWGPLCEFLGKEVPDVPYPHILKTHEHRAVFRQGRIAAVKMLLVNCLVKGIVPLAVLACLWLNRGGIKGQIKAWLSQ